MTHARHSRTRIGCPRPRGAVRRARPAALDGSGEGGSAGRLVRLGHEVRGRERRAQVTFIAYVAVDGTPVQFLAEQRTEIACRETGDIQTS